ncbi:MAG: hypothetical protein ACRDT0_15010 [Pseudonocardiaceae bacterium]
MTPLPDPASALSTLLLLLTLGYALACTIWPYKPCRRCSGAGKLRSPLGRSLRHCPRCRGTGLRLRAGRRAYNHLRRLHRDTTHTRKDQP